MLALTMGFTLTGLPQCWAAGGVERWTATSRTAEAITGNITLRSDQIIVAGGKSLPIKMLKDVSFTDDIGKTAPATIYQIVTPADPVLSGGNRICGGPKAGAPVQFIIIWHTQPISPGEGAGRAFAAYSRA